MYSTTGEVVGNMASASFISSEGEEAGLESGLPPDGLDTGLPPAGLVAGLESGLLPAGLEAGLESGLPPEGLAGLPLGLPSEGEGLAAQVVWVKLCMVFKRLVSECAKMEVKNVIIK
jgi:hypothetical protein